MHTYVHNMQLVTRAVRVIDLITNLDMTSFHSLGGWDKMVRRLEVEVGHCREDVPGVLSEEVKSATPKAPSAGEEPVSMDTEEAGGVEAAPDLPPAEFDEYSGEEGQCMPERAALIKSILNFLKKAIPDPAFAENIRSCEWERVIVEEGKRIEKDEGREEKVRKKGGRWSILAGRGRFVGLLEMGHLRFLL